MSTAVPGDAEGRLVDPLGFLILDQKPKEGDQAAPSCESEHDRQQKSDTASKEGLGWRGVLLLFWLVIPQLMWVGVIAYLGHRLLF